MRLVRLNGAVSHRPTGTVSLPPPLSAIAATAASNAAVFTVRPSPNAPNSLRSYTGGEATHCPIDDDAARLGMGGRV